MFKITMLKPRIFVNNKLLKMGKGQFLYDTVSMTQLEILNT